MFNLISLLTSLLAACCGDPGCPDCCKSCCGSERRA
jgi:hypothetical protein